MPLLSINEPTCLYFLGMTKEGQVRVKPQTPMDILGVYILQPQQRLSKL